MSARRWIEQKLGWGRSNESTATAPRSASHTADPAHATVHPAQAPATRAEVLQWIMQSKWFLIDQLEKQQPQPPVLQCPICDCRRPADLFAVFESFCQFGGGRLLRRSCPDCGVIFGPTKMMQLTEDELAQEYRLLYLTYSENDTTENELRTFHALQPRKNGVYLNYGSGGAWNSAIQRLRAEGWNLYGFEPYAETSGDFIIRSYDKLRQMKFDGIMSNNLIEHLPDPTLTFRQWASLLKTPQSLMAHSTACYEYRYAFTRFHFFFFTGRSLDVLCARTGFRAQEVAKDGEYICYRFSPEAAAVGVHRAAA